MHVQDSPLVHGGAPAFDDACDHVGDDRSEGPDFPPVKRRPRDIALMLPGRAVGGDHAVAEHGSQPPQRLEILVVGRLLCLQHMLYVIGMGEEERLRREQPEADKVAMGRTAAEQEAERIAAKLAQMPERKARRRRRRSPRRSGSRSGNCGRHGRDPL